MAPPVTTQINPTLLPTWSESESDVSSSGGSSSSSSSEEINLKPKGKTPVPHNPKKRIDYDSNNDLNPTEPDATINMKRVREQVTAYQDLGEGFSKGTVLDDSLHKEVEIAFSAFKGLVVPDKNKNVQIEFIDGINIDKAIVWIREADGSGANTKKLSELMDGNQDLANMANKLVALAKKVWPKAQTSPSSTIAPRCKAPSNASPVSPSAITRTITNDYSTCAKTAMQICTPYLNPSEQDKALKRITAAESIISEMQKTIGEELKTHKSNLKNAVLAQKPQDQATAQAAIDELKQYKKIHRLGLYVAIAFASSIDLSDMDHAFYSANQVASMIQSALQKHLDTIQEEMGNKEYLSLVPNKIQDMLWDTPKPPKDETTAKWAAALAYSVLPEELARKGAAGYWAKEKSVAYKDGVEDDLVRFIVRKEQNPASTAEVATPVLDRMFDTVKKHHAGFAPTLPGLKGNAEPILQGQDFAQGADIDSKMTELRTRHPAHKFI